jgi:hypothetical protein
MMLMRCVLVIVLVSILFGCSFSNKGKNFIPHYADWELKEDSISHHCLWRNTYSFEERLSFYPYSEAVKISLISFRYILNQNFNNSIPLQEDGVLVMDSVLAIHELSTRGIDSLTSIFFNVGFHGTILVMEGTGCIFDPHHAILFLDEHDHVLEYIAICFSCNQSKTSSAGMPMGEFCTGKYTLLKEFFQHEGIPVE